MTSHNNRRWYSGVGCTTREYQALNERKSCVSLFRRKRVHVKHHGSRSNSSDERKQQRDAWQNLHFPGVKVDEEDEESSTDESIRYTAAYYNRGASINGRRTAVTKPLMRSNSNRNRKCGNALLCESFETQETANLEDETETSVSTQATFIEDEDEDDASKQQRCSPSLAVQAKIRWRDYVYADQPLSTVHTVEDEEPATCRIVVFLLMNNHPAKDKPGDGTVNNNNFEFLHCEFNTEDRLRISDLLAQISQLAGVEPDRPFTSLCLQGKELINLMHIQDYYLQDGQSILVALRQGAQDRNMLLKQSALLLADDGLRREIRKTRIAGKSLQTLYGSNEWKERGEQHALGDGNKDANDDDDGADEEENEEDDYDDNSFADKLSLGSLEEDFGNHQFGLCNSEELTWFEDSDKDCNCQSYTENGEWTDAGPGLDALFAATRFSP